MTTLPAYRSVDISNGAGTESARLSALRQAGLAGGARRYRLAPGLAVVALSDGVLFEGVADRQIVRGGAVPIVTSILPLLDGEHDAPAIAQALDVPLGHVEQVVALLDRGGLLEACDEGVEQAPRGVCLVGEGPLADAVRDALLASGVAVGGAGELAVLCDDARLADWDVHDRVLRVACFGSTLEIGPLFDSDHPPCADGLSPETDAPGEGLLDLAGPLVAAAAQRVVAGVDNDLRRPGSYLHLDLAAWKSDRRVAVGDVALSLAYEQMTQPLPAGRLDARCARDLVDRPPAERRLRDFPTAPRLPLAPATLLTTAHRTSAPVLGDGELGMILSAASRPEHRLAVEGVERPWDRPSTAGDLGGISLYAVASRVAGVPPRRALFYDGCDHCLVPVLDQEVEELALGRALGFAPDDWASISAVVVLAIALPLLLAGYRNLALKAGLLAGGTAAAKIRAVAGHVGLRAQLVDSWDGAVLARELDLHPELEPIAAIVALSA